MKFQKSANESINELLCNEAFQNAPASESDMSFELCTNTSASNKKLCVDGTSISNTGIFSLNLNISISLTYICNP